MPSPPRRCPRYPQSRAGEVELPARGRKLPSSVVPMVLRDVSADGIGIRLERTPDRSVTRGESLKLRFLAGSRSIEIPGQVVWLESGARAGVTVGVKLALALAGSMNRQAYAAWVDALSDA